MSSGLTSDGQPPHDRLPDSPALQKEPETEAVAEEDDERSPLLNLPDVCVDHVMSFVPTNTLFAVIMSDIHDKWKDLAEREVVKRDSLNIRMIFRCDNCGGEETCLDCRRKCFAVTEVCVNEIGSHECMQQVMRMKLKTLSVIGIDDEFFHLVFQFVSHLFFQNAATLESVTVRFSLPVKPGLKYPNLWKMATFALKDKVVDACPNLTDLIIDAEGKWCFHVTRRPIPSLKRLTIRDTIAGSVSGLIHFVMSQAEHLEELDILSSDLEMRKYAPHSSSDSSSDDEEEVVFQKLKVFRGSIFTRAVRFPVLREATLHMYNRLSLLSDLPVDSMRSLIIERFDCLNIYCRLRKLKNVVSRLIHLTRLELNLKNRIWDRGLLTKDISDLFQSLHDLQSVTLTVDNQFQKMDLMVQRLVDGNRELRELHLNDVPVNDTELDSISQLTELQDLTLTAGSGLTTNGLLKLFSGQTRATLRRLKVCGSQDLDMSQVEEEFGLMLTRRGLKRHSENWGRGSDDGHVYSSA